VNPRIAPAATPTQEQLILPLPTVLDEYGPLRGTRATDAVAERIGLPPPPSARARSWVVRANGSPSGTAPCAGPAKTRLRGLTERDADGRWRLTAKARNGLMPAAPEVVVTVETDAGIALRARPRRWKGCSRRAASTSWATACCSSCTGTTPPRCRRLRSGPPCDASASRPRWSRSTGSAQATGRGQGKQRNVLRSYSPSMLRPLHRGGTKPT
jgi:hypothetical protein